MISGSIGYYLNEIDFGLSLLELDINLEQTRNIPIDKKFWKKEFENYIFYVNQIKFMCYMCGYIKKPKENPNDILRNYTE